MAAKKEDVDSEIPQFTEKIICPTCGGVIPTLKMQIPDPLRLKKPKPRFSFL